uniref:Uncharacterized protein n=1 Tax=Anguilla anguilla TaxID=7936 RepID=A0A0E9W815_ANGAN
MIHESADYLTISHPSYEANKNTLQIPDYFPMHLSILNQSLDNI